MSKFVDWLYAHHFLPQKKRWAEERVQTLVRQQDAAYQKLMIELSRINKAVKDTTNGDNS